LNEDTRKRIEELFNRCGRGIGSYVLLRVRSPELAEEITARVFLNVVRSIRQQRGSIVAWLWAIVRSELSRHYRERPTRSLPQDLVAFQQEPLDDLERVERQRLLQTALAELPEEHQEILTFKFFLNLSNVEIAEIAGLSASNVGVKIHRALKVLRDRLSSLAPFDHAPTEW
jgi:RNA polymerase sigma-70 factor (ECF subfamily)